MTTSWQRQTGFSAPKGAFQPRALRCVLVANRGEIALRLLRCAKAAGLRTVAVYTAEDQGAPHATLADVAVELEGSESQGKGYLDQEAIVRAARENGAQAVLPGYGFLSENASFAKRVEDAGLVFAGPTPETIEQLGLKHRCRELAERAGVACVPGSGLLGDVDEARSEARRVGYPVMLKASAGGGGLGLQVCRDEAELARAYETVVSRGKSLFGDGDCFLERFVERARHVEVQLVGNGQGDVIHVGERECSIQRRHQKVVEEAPSPFAHAHAGFREAITAAAVRFGRSARYRSAGTLEFLVDDGTAEFYLCEANTRLQVEHCVSEEVWGVDIVALMLQQADYQLQGKAGIPADVLASYQGDQPRGWAIEARVYCENPLRDFAPSPGLLQEVAWAVEPSHDRVEGWVQTGTRVTPTYDPLLAKVISSGATRDEAATRLARLLRESRVYGPTNLDFLAAVVESRQFRSGETLTSFLRAPSPSAKGFRYRANALEVVDGGVSTSVQDWPARLTVGHGLPVSGPLDSVSFRLANVLVGNAPGVEALEMTLRGATLKFHADAVVALTGAELELSVDGERLESHTAWHVAAGSELKVGSLREGAEGGCRAYLAIRGGFPTMPRYLGSKATTAMLGLGGHQGRDLLPGDVLYLAPLPPGAQDPAEQGREASTPPRAVYRLPEALRLGRTFGRDYRLYCMRGPFDDDAFLMRRDRETLYGGRMRTSHNVARSGVRFDADDLEWARPDGGEGGSHPSNVIEFSYSINGLNYNGDTPILLGNDGPDLGGLLIALTLVGAEYRAGQLSPGDTVQWVPVTFEQARELSARQERFLDQVAEAVARHEGETGGRAGGAEVTPLDMSLADLLDHERVGSPILARVGASASGGEEGATSSRPEVVVRAAGDRNVVLEFGEESISLPNRCRVELLLRQVVARRREGVLLADPNVRSLTLRFDAAKVSQSELVKFLLEVEASLPDATRVEIPCRQWRMPVCFDHPAVAAAVQRYRETVRDQAVYIDAQPHADNKPYLAKANGLASVDDVERAVLDTEHLVVANGFFLGTPILLPRDPRRRLRSIKYNPTRLTTPEGALGYGGSCGAIYGVESSGGYQIFARTLPGWSTWGTAPGFEPSRPWLFGIFDTITWYRVDVPTYDGMLRSLKAGSWRWEVREAKFDVAEQVAFESSVRKETDEFRKRQAEALRRCEAEEARLYREWSEEKQRRIEERMAGAGGGKGGAGGDDDWDWENDAKAVRVVAPMSASVWKMCSPGQRVSAGDSVAVLEAMKTEVPVAATVDVVVRRVLLKPGSIVSPGDVLAVALPA